MLSPDVRVYPYMFPEELTKFQQAVAEEKAGEAENRGAAAQVIPHPVSQCEQAVAIVSALRSAREAPNVSLAELEARTGICRSMLSRLANSKAPNPTLATLQPYAFAIGVPREVSLRARNANE